MRAKLLLFFLALVSLAFYMWYNGQEESASKNRKDTATYVRFVVAQKASIAIVIDALGTVTPRSTVTIQSRVDGQLTHLYFNEGQMVQKDDVLAQLDDRPFLAQLKQAEGQKLRNEAILQEARQTLERYKNLFQKDSIPKQQLDTQSSLVKQYEGAVKNDQGLVDSAQTQLDYTRITAPVSGRIGLRKADIGNIIKASNAEGIAVITEIDPISVLFSVPEDNIPQVMRYAHDAKVLTVEAWNRENTLMLAKGSLTAMDNQVDSTTGTLKMRAEFANPEATLFPNQFVNVRLKLGDKSDAIVLPASSLQRGSAGTFVYRIKENNTVEAVPIKVGVTDADNVSVESGLASGDKIVTEGASSLKNGAKVHATPPTDEKQPASP